MSWPTVELGEICRPKQWKTLPKKDLLQSGYTVYGANGPIGYTDSYTHDRKTLIVGCRGSCGSLHIMPEKSYANGNAMALGELRSERVNLDYLYRLLEARGFDDVITGSSQPQIIRSNIERIKIPLPPLEEQNRIAGILDQADALRRLRTRALDKLNTLGQAIFHEMFGKTVKPISVQQMLDEKMLLLHKDGNHGANYPRKEEFGSTGVPFISAKAIDDHGGFLEAEIEFLNEAKAQSLKIGWIKAGDVLLSHNASVGKVARYMGDLGNALIGTSLTCYRPNPDKLKSGFLEFALKSYAFQTQLKSNMSQTTRNQVPITAQKHLELTIPSIDEQSAFESKTSYISEAAVAGQRVQRNQDALFASLQHRAFRGEL